jgi:hypothetical protein
MSTNEPEIATIMQLVAREHLALQRLLEDVERAANAARDRRPGGIEQLHASVWELYLAVDEHLFLEEKYVAPILGKEAAVQMILEHNDQRAALLVLVEDSEADLRAPEELAIAAIALVVRLRADMVIEERTLAPLGFRQRVVKVSRLPAATS